MIHFKLKELDKIVPWGKGSEVSLHWFGLTDGYLWLTFGNETIYEYSQEILDYWRDITMPYVDYQLSRFIEDFTGLFENISEPVPEEFYDLTKDLEKFQSETKNWLNNVDSGRDGLNEEYFEAYDALISWTSIRTMDNGHLVGGPQLSFFRYNQKVRIIWRTDHSLENGINMWAAKNGSLEMDYYEFVQKIKVFGDTFFSRMEEQIRLAVKKDWGSVKIDKKGMISEQKKREKDFHTSLALLEEENGNRTDWTKIKEVLDKMKSEIK
ncbi:DUF5984 family protein [Allomuricauda taeanensis]|uniref:DUF5984 family protein n=1 Tax=Flagellimonas taeanensis TaxID=1005926 RepID=UPI002E7C14AA|nr:DUF5984 family protein [Allomuricauda taeanensis]MEE1963955.1 DUF5984 family protein [Allomuricauda taeanensis]